MRAQPTCPPGPYPHATTCAGACVICGSLDGFSSATQQTAVGQVIPGFCTMIVHSMKYVAFIAGSATLDFDVSVGQCTLGSAIEMGVYEFENCTNPVLVSNCNTQMNQNNTWPFTATGLHPGCVYYLAFDNNGPAACPFTVNITSGSTGSPPLPPPPPPVGPVKVCPNSEVTYSIPPQPFACDYQWTAPPGATINGMASPVSISHETGTMVTVKWGNQGGQICVRSKNSCEMSPPACLPVIVEVIPPTQLPDTTVCFGESFEWLDGMQYTGNQALAFNYVLPNGCDSLVKINLKSLPQKITQLGPQPICKNGCITIAGQNFCAPGNYEVVLQTPKGCDSLIRFTAVEVVVDAEIGLPDTLTCLADSVLLDGSNSIGNTWIWLGPTGQFLGNDTAQMTALVGNHQLILQKIFQGKTCRDTAQVIVNQNVTPPGVEAVGDSLTCLQPVGQLFSTTSPPNLPVEWNGPGGFFSNLQNPPVNQPGLYFLTATNLQNGCTSIDTTEVFDLKNSPTAVISGFDSLTCSLPQTTLSASSNLPTATFQWIENQQVIGSLPTVNLSLPGLVLLVATNPANGCTASDSIQIFENKTPPTALATGGLITCANPQFTLSGNSNIAVASFQWIENQQVIGFSQNFTTNHAGIFTLFVTDPSNGCTATDTAQVFADQSIPQVVVLGDALSCNFPSVQLIGGSSLPDCQFFWSGPGGWSSTAISPMVDFPGNFTLVVTAPNGCSATGFAEILPNQTPIDLTATGATITCFDPSPTATASSTMPFPEFQWFDNQGILVSFTANVITTIPGIYTVQVVASNGCTAETTVEIFEETTPPDLSANGATLTCTMPQAELTATSQTPGATFQWLEYQQVISNSATFNSTSPGIFEAVATDPANGCTTSLSVEIFENKTPPDLSANGATLTCAMPTVQLLATSQTPGATFQWLDNQQVISNSAVLNSSSPGIFEAVATDVANGCTTSFSVEIFENKTPPDLSANGATLTCAMPQAELTATSQTTDASFQWLENQQVISNSAALNSSLPGIFEAIATDPANGCTTSFFVEIFENKTPPDLSANGATLTCAMPTAQLLATSQTPGATFQWLENQQVIANSATLNSSLPGIFEAVATDPANGCSTTFSVEIFENKTPPTALATGGELDCQTGQITLTGSSQTLGATFQWLDNQGVVLSVTSKFISTTDGIFELIATDPTNGCTALDTAQVFKNQNAPQASATGDSLTCVKLTAQLSGSTATPGAIGEWTGPGGFSSQNSMTTVGQPGLFSWTVTATNGCKSVVYVLISENKTPPELTAAPPDTLTCTNLFVQLSATSQTPGATFQWLENQQVISVSSKFISTSPGIFEVVATNAANGCTTDFTVEIFQKISPPGLAAKGDTITCFEPTAQLLATSPTAAATFQWLENQQVVSVLWKFISTSPGVFEVIATDPATGCRDSLTVEILADNLPPIFTATGDTLTCLQPVGTLKTQTVQPGLMFQWFENQALMGNSPTYTDDAPGQFECLATDPSNGCTASVFVEMAEDKAAPQAAALPDSLGLGCQTDSIFLAAVFQQMPAVFNWHLPDGSLAPSPSIWATQPGIFSWQAVNPNGCSATDSIKIFDSNNGIKSVSLDLETPVCVDDPPARLAVAGVSGGTAPMSYSIDNQPFTTNFDWKNLPPGDHFLKLKDANGCEFDTTFSVSEPVFWEINLGPDTTIFFGETIDLIAQTDPPDWPISKLRWQSVFACDTCFSRPVSPKNDRWFSILATDVNGCKSQDSILVRVVEPDIYVPNVFAPNSDSGNERWRFFAGPGVVKIRRLAVFTRWGESVHVEKDVAISDPLHGWDGRYRGVPVPVGVYVWFAQVELAGGQVRRLKGDLTVVR